VQQLSDKVWRHNPNALILVYPHYFSGARVPGINVTASRQPFDPRWGLIFAPHSAHFDSALMAKAKTTAFWSDAPALHTPREVAAAARTGQQHSVTGFIPSLEALSFIAREPESGEPWIWGNRIHPYGFDPEREGKVPYKTLPVRVQRFAYRMFSR